MSQSEKPLAQFEFDHDIQLQLADSAGFLVENTQFIVRLKIVKTGSQVSIQLPTINFQTGQRSSQNFNDFLVIPGGFIYTTGKFLPSCLCPSSLVRTSYSAPSNNGVNSAYSLNQYPNGFPVPIAGYIIELSPSGQISISAEGTFKNIIPVGNQIVLPTNLVYTVTPKFKLAKNSLISPGTANVTQFPPGPASDNFRDTHVNDAYDKIVAWTWTDNSTVLDKSNGVLNAWVAIGAIRSNGEIKVNSITQLTSLARGFMAWDTAVAINRTNLQNIVVSYGLITYDTTLQSPISITPYIVISNDGVKPGPSMSHFHPMRNRLEPQVVPVIIVEFRLTSTETFGMVIPMHLAILELTLTSPAF